MTHQPLPERQQVRSLSRLRSMLGAAVVAALGAAQPALAGNVQFGSDRPAVAYTETQARAAQQAGARMGAEVPIDAKAGLQGGSTWAPAPGTLRAILPPAALEDARRKSASRVFPADLLNGDQLPAPGKGTAVVAALRIGGDANPLGPASIPELARALRNDVDLIYQYIRNNIEYHPAWGIQKGALGTVIDNQGTAMDQAALMVELLRAAGHTANYVRGVVRLSAAQVKAWYGYDTGNVCAVLGLLGQAQIPIADINATAAGSCPGLNATLVNVAVEHVWVKVNIGGNDYVFDPSHKPHTFTSGIDLAAAAGYNATTFLNDAKSGATINGNYVQGINRTNIRNNLETHAGNLANWLRTNKPAATLDDVIGGKAITPMLGSTLRQTTLPYQDSGYTTITTTAIDAGYKPTLRVVYQGIDKTFTSDAIYGKRLSITFNGSNLPVLRLDGTTVATGASAVAPGASSTITFVVWHNAYAATFADHAFTQRIKGGGTYAIANAWGPTGRGLAQKHLSAMDDLVTSGSASASEPVLASSLNVLAAQWLGQNTHMGYLAERIGDSMLIHHHQVGIAGYTNASYVDLPSSMVSVANATGNVAKENATFGNWAMHNSILESTTVHQTMGVAAVSTVSLIDKAASSGLRLYNGSAANYTGQVKPNLLNCAAHLTSFQAAIDSGQRLIVPQRCDLTEGAWSGVGYFTVGSGLYLGSIISDGLSGGLPINAASTGDTVFNTSQNAVGPLGRLQQTGYEFFGDPIDMVKGHFVYENDDINVGVGAFPHSLSFQRLYSSGLRTQDGPLGKGWSHNFNASVRQGSDGFQGMGEDSALDAVHALVEARASHDLLLDAAKPTEKLVIAAIAQRWFGEKITGNTVIVTQGLNGEVFTQLPGGAYNPPPGKPVRLIKNADGSHTYEQLHRGQLVFNTSGKLARYDDPSGLQVKLTYSGNNLTQVENSLGRVLSLAYSGSRVTQVGDGTRTVKYAYDASGNLTSHTDAANQATTFQYDLPGRITQFFYPGFPTTPAVTNTYDSLGRVKTQTSARGKLYQYFFAGYRSEELGPGNTSRAHYLDAAGNTLQQSDPVGRWIVSAYDGHSRLVKRTWPEGNSTEYTYDDATCATANKRCTHNVKTIKQLPKPGSGAATLTRSFAYYAASNKVATASDARAKITSYTYNSQHLPLTVTQPVDAAGVAPVTTFGYTSFSRSGWNPFLLPTSQTVNTTASNSVVTTTAYNAGNKYVPQTSVLDSGTGKLNLTTTFTYDGIGNLTQVNGPRTDVTDTTSHTYDAQRRVTATTDAAGKKTQTSYDPDGRPIKRAAQTGTQWLVSCTTYSATGKPTIQWGPAQTAAATTCPSQAAPVPREDTEYDDLDRPWRVTQYLSAAEGGNRVSETVYNADDSVQIVKKAVGSALAQNHATYAYTGNGQIASVKDARNSLTAHLYDGHDRLYRTHYPLPATPNTANADDYEQYTYDANGNVIAHRKRSGQNVTQAYDNLNRLVIRNYPASADNLQYSYDLRGLRTEAKYANGSHATTYAWDNAGRLLGSTSGARTVSHQYDAAGNRTRTTWPDAYYTTTAYDALNRPTQIKENGSASLASYAYDDLSRRATVTLGNGTSTGYVYDPQGNLGSLEHFLSGTAQDIKYTYTRNRRGEITQVATSNNLYHHTPATGTQSYSANGLNQYTAVAGKSVTHDANGNLTGDGTWTYGYDPDNRLKSASKTAAPAVSATLAYDAQGRLRQTTIGGATTELLYDGQDLIAEYSGTSVSKRYVHGPGVDEPLVVYEGTGTGTKQWLYADHLGSIVAQGNATGAGTLTLSYGAFGEPSAPTNALRWRYTGQQYIPQLGLYYYKARFYSPNLGRFLQTDPVGYADGLNWYAYVGNNPVNRVDPRGLTGVARGNAGGVLVACGPGCAAIGEILTAPPVIGGSPGNAGAAGYDPRTDTYYPGASKPSLGSLSLDSLGPTGKLINGLTATGQAIGNWVLGDQNAYAKPPANAYDPAGPKAPGKPPADAGFSDPKGGENWVSNPNPGKGGGSYGWEDVKGDVWVPSGPGGRAHGGAHWDVQTPGGGYRNVRPPR